MTKTSAAALSRPAYKLGVGLDIAALSFTAATCLPDQAPLKALDFKQTPQDFSRLDRYLKATNYDPSDILIVLEVTGPYWLAVALYLEQHGYALSVINPSRARDFAKSLLIKPKNDQIDAQTLALLAITLKPARWLPPPSIYRELAPLMQQRTDLLGIRTRLRNQKHALTVAQAGPSVLTRLERLIETFTAQLNEIETEVKAVLATDKDWAKSVLLLQTINGIGPVTACWLVLISLNFSVCHKAESLVHFAGLAPIERRSGTSVRGRPMIGHGGNGPLRALIYMAAGSAIRFNPVLKAYFEELHLNKGKPYKVARCAAARKLLHFAFAVVTSGKAFDPEIARANCAKRLAPKATLVS